MAQRKIKFSRHASRRMTLYKIDEETISAIIGQRLKLNNHLEDGKYEIIGNNPKTDSKYPIKVVFSVEEKDIIVITAYPLKRGMKNENLL